ncbi:MAG: hypothetical protein M3N53_00885 [Actinomycetota bacterium]|nr:hypothetical protein [Actinomycetota bacterium]
MKPAVVGALLVMTLSLAAMPVTTAEAASVTHEVQFAALTDGVDAEVIRAFPGSLRVHSGDLIHFTGNLSEAIPEAGVHGAAVLPKGESPAEWLPERATNLEGPWAAFVRDPDEQPDRVAEAWKIPNRVIFPSRPQCGATADNPCEFDGTGDGDQGVLGSGMGWGLNSFLDFYVRVTAEPGTTLWALCPFHPAIRVRIDVVPEDEAVTTPEQLASRRDAAVAKYEKKAVALHEDYVDARVGRQRADGSKVWQAWAGLEEGPIFLAGMYPKTLRVRAGDSVKWNFGRKEVHTVSFPLDTALQTPWLTVKCDLDTDSGTAEDVDGAPAPPFCPGATTQVEFDLDHTFPLPIGNGAFAGSDDFETSGLRGYGLPGLNNAPYRLRFRKASGAEGFTYACMLHYGMRGKIVVR